jgi:signal transduction histidine kinase
VADTRLRILLVEADRDDAASEARGLAATGGCDVEWTGSLEGALEALGARRPDAVVLDLALGDGLGAIARIHADAPAVPVVVLGPAEAQPGIEAVRAGAQDCLVKGRTDGEALLRAVRHAVERKRLDEALARMMLADRMASIGTLAAGVAHEINNPLAYMIANLDVVGQALGHAAACAEPAGGMGDALVEAQALLREVRHGAERVRQIVRDLKTFSRLDEDVRAPVDVRALLDATVNMAWMELRHRARLVKDYRPVSPVLAHEARLGQVWLNLLLNAAQAIPEGATERNEIRIVTRSDDGRVVVEVHDTGAGIPPEHLGRLFDPFFTTKPIGVGTGLGLYTCHNIVAALGGGIAVESEVGRGTMFRVTLPAAHPADREPTPRPRPALAGRRGRVLVVDDDRMVGVSVFRLLSSEHDVTVTSSAAEALEQLESRGEFDVILCDLMMPDMTGMDLYEELFRRSPETARRVLFITGGAFTPRAREFLADVPNARIEKPFDGQSLRALIRERMR